MSAVVGVGRGLFSVSGRRGSLATVAWRYNLLLPRINVVACKLMVLIANFLGGQKASWLVTSRLLVHILSRLLRLVNSRLLLLLASRLTQMQMTSTL